MHYLQPLPGWKILGTFLPVLGETAVATPVSKIEFTASVSSKYPATLRQIGFCLCSAVRKSVRGMALVNQDQQANECLVVGITGSIGAGKSLVGELLAGEGVPIIDTDAIVHLLLQSNEHIQRAIVNRFGPGVLAADRTIDRGKLAQLVFADHQARTNLEAILHPAVLAECNRQLAALSDRKIVAVLVPLLFEAGLEREYDQIWTVITRDDILLARLREKRGMSDAQINARLSIQLPQAEKAARSHKVIDNSGTISETKNQILNILAQLRTP